MTAGLIPWTSTGAFFTGAMGVATVDYAPWALLSYVNITLSIAFAFLGIAVLKVPGGRTTESAGKHEGRRILVP